MQNKVYLHFQLFSTACQYCVEKMTNCIFLNKCRETDEFSLTVYDF